ncbi:hypothetical protein Ancab_001112 [Ancistrocladus abbreviatus]
MSRRNPTSEVDDPAIKLFGRNITVPDSLTSSDSVAQSPAPATESSDASCAARKLEVEKCNRNKVNGEYGNPRSEEGSQEKAFKKPDKIVPCPRCNSMETKFCYFNNYNVNQPRHFCKSCHRYWTAGGTIRNVPVGARRRKNKHASSDFQAVVVSSGEEAVTQLNLSSANHFQASQTELSSHAVTSSETREVLMVESDAQVSESVIPMLSFEGQKNLQDTSGVALGKRAGLSSPPGSFMTSSTFRKNDFSDQEAQMEQVGFCAPESHGTFTPLTTMLGFLGPPLAYPLNTGWNRTAYSSDCSHTILVPWSSSAMTTVPGFCTPGITFPYVQSHMYKWSNSSSSVNSSPSLGKHSRDSNSPDELKTEKCLSVPKTLRIDHPDEAAKSSMWATLGTKPGKDKPISKGGIFKAFPLKAKSNMQTSETEQVLQAKPAALS